VQSVFVKNAIYDDNRLVQSDQHSHALTRQIHFADTDICGWAWHTTYW